MKRGCDMPYTEKHEIRRIKDIMKATKGPYLRFN